MTRQEAFIILNTYLHNKNLIKHSLAAEAAMKEIYNHLHQGRSSFSEATANKWGLTGLLHDVDYEMAQETNQLDKHGLLIFDHVSNIPEDIAHAIKAHNFENTRVLPENDMDWAIACADQLTGLITAVALVRPEKSLAAVTTEAVLKKFPNPSFAKGASREAIKRCEEKLNIPIDKFVTLTLEAMQKISPELGL